MQIFYSAQPMGFVVGVSWRLRSCVGDHSPAKRGQTNNEIDLKQSGGPATRLLCDDNCMRKCRGELFGDLNIFLPEKCNVIANV